MGRPKRQVLADAVEATSPPTALGENHLLAKVIKGEGNNLFTVSLPSQEILLVELRSTLRNTFWMKRGSFVVVDTAALAERDNKLGGEIAMVVMDEKSWRKMSYW